MEWREQKDWNPLMRGVLLVALTAFLVKLIITGDIKQYIHPKFIWFTASAALGLSLMALGQLARALRGATGGPVLRVGLYTAVTAVLCTGFLLRPVTFSANLAAKQGLNITKRAEAVILPEPAPVTPPEPQPVVEASEPAPEPAPAVAPAPKPETKPEVEITTANFVTWMNELYKSPNAYAGKRVSMEGFVFHPPKTKPEEFAVTRLVVTCHVAHAFPDGLLAYLPSGERPNQDQWYRAEGVLEPTVHEGTQTLRIKVERWTPIEQPADPYIYP